MPSWAPSLRAHWIARDFENGQTLKVPHTWHLQEPKFLAKESLEGRLASRTFSGTSVASSSLHKVQLGDWGSLPLAQLFPASVPCTEYPNRNVY